jgi:hypothetical protein
MEEEGARRRAYKGRDGAGRSGFLAGLNEDDEDQSDEETTVPSQSQGQQVQQPYDGRAGQRDMPGRHARPIELSFDGATLLGRRQLRDSDGRIPIDLSPLAIKADKIDAPRSAMQY